MKPSYSDILWHCDIFTKDKNYRKMYGNVVHLVWFGRRWRKLLDFKPIEGAALDYNGRSAEGYITLEGLDKPRRVHAGMKYFMANWNTTVERELERHEFWFQRNGPQFKDLDNWYVTYYHNLDPNDYKEK